MVDIWMVFMMFYPFLIVSLYTVREVLKNKNNKVMNKNCNWIEQDEECERKIRMVCYLLNAGLPLLMSMFISLYWTIGLFNYFSPDVHGVC